MSDMNTVYRAADIEEADIIVAWLEERGITAQVKGSLEIPVVYNPGDIEVCVADPDEAKQAIALLRDHYQHEAPVDAGGTIEAMCEECGQASTFPSDQRGTVQNCPHCGEYLDVPGDADADFPDGSDAGASEGT